MKIYFYTKFAEFSAVFILIRVMYAKKSPPDVKYVWNISKFSRTVKG